MSTLQSIRGEPDWRMGLDLAGMVIPMGGRASGSRFGMGGLNRGEVVSFPSRGKVTFPAGKQQMNQMIDMSTAEAEAAYGRKAPSNAAATRAAFEKRLDKQNFEQSLPSAASSWLTPTMLTAMGAAIGITGEDIEPAKLSKEGMRKRLAEYLEVWAKQGKAQ